MLRAALNYAILLKIKVRLLQLSICELTQRVKEEYSSDGRDRCIIIHASCCIHYFLRTSLVGIYLQGTKEAREIKVRIDVDTFLHRLGERNLGRISKIGMPRFIHSSC